MAKEKENKKNNYNGNSIKGIKGELKRVVWPTPKQMVSNVTAVVVIVIITALIVFCLDFVFRTSSKYGINELKKKVESNKQETSEMLENTQTVDNSDTQNVDGTEGDNTQPTEESNGEGGSGSNAEKTTDKTSDESAQQGEN